MNAVYTTATCPSVLDAPLAEFDPAIAGMLDRERARQQRGLEMIASANYAPRAVMQAQDSVLTNEYVEGYPGRRYYGGCERIGEVESLALDRVKTLFSAEYAAEYANVQPHSGAQANVAAMHALITHVRADNHRVDIAEVRS